MKVYILATVVILVVKWIASLLFSLFYLAIGFHKANLLFTWKQEVGKALLNICSNVVAIYALLFLLNKLQIQSTIAMLIGPIFISLIWSHFNIKRARIGVAPHSQIRPMFDDYRRRIQDQFGQQVVEAVAGEDAFISYLLRSEYAYVLGNILGIVLGGIILLRGAALV